MEKTLKDMNKRFTKVEAEGKKQLMKERALTKKALDGL
jgi:hypothetical protein